MNVNDGDGRPLNNGKNLIGTKVTAQKEALI